MFRIKGSEFILENGTFNVSVFQNLNLSEKKRAFINEQLTNSIIPDSFELKYYFDGDVFVDITKTYLKFYGHGANVLNVEIELKINDDDIKTILQYFVTDFENDSDKEEELIENDKNEPYVNIKDIDKEENDNISTMEKVLYGRVTA